MRWDRGWDRKDPRFWNERFNVTVGQKYHLAPPKLYGVHTTGGQLIHGRNAFSYSIQHGANGILDLGLILTVDDGGEGGGCG